MWLNVTQKSRDLFRDYPTVRSSSIARQGAIAKPLLSWHATVQQVGRQRIVLLSHDASALCVVLPPSQGAGRLETRFWAQLALQWTHYHLPAEGLSAYRRTVGDWQINQPVNQRQVRRLNEQALYVTFLIKDQGITDPLALSLLAAQTPALGRQAPEHVVQNLKVDLALSASGGDPLADKQD